MHTGNMTSLCLVMLHEQYRVTRGNSVVGVIWCYGCKFDLYHRIAPKEAKKSTLTSPYMICGLVNIDFFASFGAIRW